MSRVWTQQPQIESPLLDSRQQVINGFGRVHGTSKVATTNLFTRSVGSLGTCQLQPAGTSTNYAVYPINPITIGTGDFTYCIVFEPLIDESSNSYIYTLGSNTTFGFAAKHTSSGNGAGIYIGGAIVNPNIPHLMLPVVHKVVVRRVNGVIYVNADKYSGSVSSSASVSSISSLVLGSYTTSGGASFYFGCKYYLAGIQLGAWSEAQAKAFVNNPWQIFQPLPSRIFVGPAASGGEHVSFGDLLSNNSNLNATSSITRTHSSDGTIISVNSTIFGNSTRTRVHSSDGIITSTSSLLSAQSNRYRQFSASGNITLTSSTVTASASRTHVHTSTGSVIATQAGIVSSASRIRIHAASGTLTLNSSNLSGIAGRGGITHFSSGTLTSLGTILSAEAVHNAVHNAIGTLISTGSNIEGYSAGSYVDYQISYHVYVSGERTEVVLAVSRNNTISAGPRSNTLATTARTYHFSSPARVTTFHRI